MAFSLKIFIIPGCTHSTVTYLLIANSLLLPRSATRYEHQRSESITIVKIDLQDFDTAIYTIIATTVHHKIHFPTYPLFTDEQISLYCVSTHKYCQNWSWDQLGIISTMEK